MSEASVSVRSDIILGALKKSCQSISPPKHEYDEKVQAGLGRFNKKEVSLPTSSGRIRMDLSALFKPEEPSKLWKNRADENCFNTIFVNVSGTGKTHQVFKLAGQGFMLYYSAGDITREMDKSLCSLNQRLTNIKGNAKEEVNKQIEAKNLVYLLIASKMAVLHKMLTENKNLSPADYLYGQLNGGSVKYTEAFGNVIQQLEGLEFGTADITTAFRKLATDTRKLTDKKIGISLDEAHVLSSGEFHDL